MIQSPPKIPEMLSQANQMQEEMQRKLSETVVEGSSGGGAITATMNGKKQLLKMRIDPSAVMSLSGAQIRCGDARRSRCRGGSMMPATKQMRPSSQSVQGMLGGLKISPPGLLR